MATTFVSWSRPWKVTKDSDFHHCILVVSNCRKYTNFCPIFQSNEIHSATKVLIVNSVLRSLSFFICEYATLYKVCRSIRPTICPSVSLFVCLFVCLSVHFYIHPSVCDSVHSFICTFVHICFACGLMSRSSIGGSFCP